MYLKNHFQLGRALAGESQILREHFLRRNCFLVGNVLPDLLFYTYLRGFDKSRRWVGHSLPYSEPTIEKSLKKRLSVGVRSCLDAYRLGVLLHYLADSFTDPHTERFTGNRFDHSRYERKLLKVFPAFLHLVRETPPAQSADFLADARRAYLEQPPSPEVDAEWIVRVCSAVFFAVGSV